MSREKKGQTRGRQGKARMCLLVHVFYYIVVKYVGDVFYFNCEYVHLHHHSAYQKLGSIQVNRVFQTR